MNSAECLWGEVTFSPAPGDVTSAECLYVGDIIPDEYPGEITPLLLAFWVGDVTLPGEVIV